MKRFFALFMAGILALAMLVAGCGGGSDKKAEKVLRVGTEPTFAPFEFQKEGSQEFTGFDMDLIRAIGKRMGYRVEIMNMGFDALVPALNAGTIDVAVSGMTITEERKQTITFSEPYYTSGLVVMVNLDNEDIKGIKDLEGKKIAVQIGTTGEIKARSVPNATVSSFNTNTEAAIELNNRGVDAVINDRPVLGYYLAQGGAKFAKTVGDVMEAEDYGIAVRKGNDDLIAAINKALAELKENGEYDKLYQTWFGEAAKAPETSSLSIMAGAFPLLLQGAAITIEISALSVFLGLLLGCFVGIARLCNVRVLRGLSKFYVDFIRGTPLLVQIFLVYFALPSLIGQRVDPFLAAISACSINSGAYVAEIFRGGIQSIDKGQMEAGRSLGMTWAQTMRYVIIPQAFKRIIPPLGNEFIAMLKDSSLVSVIGFEELTRRGQLIIARTYASFEIWLAVAVIYLVMTFAVARLVGVLERRFNNERK